MRSLEPTPRLAALLVTVTLAIGCGTSVEPPTTHATHSGGELWPAPEVTTPRGVAAPGSGPHGRHRTHQSGHRPT